jgi:WD40 repeat protein
MGFKQTILLHDIKRLGKPLHTFEAHTDEVLHLAWSPHSPTIFASASSDRRINVWDLSQIGVEQTPDDQEDGPPELMFIHGGACLPRSPVCSLPTTLDRRSYCTSLRLLLGTWGGRAVDGGKYIRGQCGNGVAADYARLGWRRGTS